MLYWPCPPTIKMEPSDIKNKVRNNHGEDISFGPIIAIIIIVALLIMGGLYVWKKVMPAENIFRQSGMTVDPVINSFAKQGSSDEISEIRRDLSATSIEALDQGLDSITNQR